jgi:hypothetical protein
MTAVLADGVSWGGLTMLVLAGVYATSTVGVTGGPNHGEHPFIVNLLHMGVAAFWALRGWASTPRWSYLGVLGVAIVLSVLVMGYSASSPRGRVWTARAAMAVLYTGLVAIVLWGR